MPIHSRGNLFDAKDLRLLPPDLPGDGNDLNDLIDAHITLAKDSADAVLFAFGIPWGPENKPDRTFKFKPNRGVHDVHMNQGNPLDGGHSQDNGVWQDGGLLLHFPDADRWVAIFLAFQSQSWHTDDETGHPTKGKTGAEAPRFDGESRTLPGPEQTYPAIEILAVRVRNRQGKAPAVLLLNNTEADVALSGYVLATSKSDRKTLDGGIPTGQTVAVDLPATFLRTKGGIVTLLAPDGLKVSGTTYPAVAQARTGWIRSP